MPPKAQKPIDDKSPEIKTNHFSFWDYVPIVSGDRRLEREMHQTLLKLEATHQRIQKDIIEAREDAQRFRAEMATKEQEIATIRKNGIN